MKRKIKGLTSAEIEHEIHGTDESRKPCLCGDYPFISREWCMVEGFFDWIAICDECDSMMETKDHKTRGVCEKAWDDMINVLKEHSIEVTINDEDYYKFVSNKIISLYMCGKDLKALITDLPNVVKMLETAEEARLKTLAELGLLKNSRSNAPEIEDLKKRLEQFEKELGQTLDPETLKKYLG